jgi:hypothetical protein
VFVAFLPLQYLERLLDGTPCLKPLPTCRVPFVERQRCCLRG